MAATKADYSQTPANGIVADMSVSPAASTNGTSPTPAPAQARQGKAPAAAGSVDLLSHPPDDAGHALTFLELHPDRFLHADAVGWLHWTGTHWKADGAEAELHQAIVDMLRARRVAAVQAVPAVEGLVRACVASRSRVLGVAFAVGMYSHANIDDFDTDVDLLNVANGVLDLRSGNLTPHDPAQRFTYCLTTEFDPAADYTRWVDFLRVVVDGGQPVIDYLQEFFGYALTGHTREECLLYLFGKTRAGKGTISEVLQKLMGRPLSAAVAFSTFVRRREAGDQGFDLAPLKAARLIVASESNERDTLNSGTVKALTGGDWITCAYKNRDQFSYRPIFKAMMLSNFEIRADPDDAALWGRVRVVHFPLSFLGREDKLLKDSLQSPDSLRGVLAWCVEGAMRWYASPAGLVTPDRVRLAVEEHRGKADDIGQWLDDCCRATPGAWTANGSLYTSYKAWCFDNGLAAKAVNKFGAALASKGYKTGVVQRVGLSTARGVEDLEIV